MVTFDEWYGVDITMSGSPKPIAKAAWDAGVEEGARRAKESATRLAPEHVAALHHASVILDARDYTETAREVRAALAALGEPAP